MTPDWTDLLKWTDVAVVLAFIGVVVVVSMLKSRKEETSEDYFLAGRGLKWWLIGFSIVASNISTEQFVGMAGQAAGGVGLAVSGYQLLGSVTIVLVALFFLPRFLRAGIYTMPEYLEYRYHPAARGIMALYTMAIYVGVTIAAVLYSGGVTLEQIFGMDRTYAIWLIAAIAAIYTTWGGLGAVVWADLFQGSALLLGGLLTMLLGFLALGGISGFFTASADRLHMVLPAQHPELPWTALVLGLWIPNFYYCGLNQFIVQRTLAAENLRQGQLGIIFAAALWLLIPFAIVFPGIMAVQLYAAHGDNAYPTLIKTLVPVGLRGVILAAIGGAVMSAMASVLNSASTIFTIDLYKRYLHRNASHKLLIAIGRVMTVVFVLIGCLIAPQLGARGIFHYIQEIQGYISPGILAAFAFGFVFPRTPAAAGVTALLLNPPLYGYLHWQYGIAPETRAKVWQAICDFLHVQSTAAPAATHEIAFLNRMAITFGVVLAAMAVITVIKPLREPKVLPVRKDFDMRPAPSVLWLGGAVIAAVAAFYAVFW